MRGISISLDTLDNGTIRATGRIDGRSVESFDGTCGQERELTVKAMKSAARAHQISDGVFDLTHINLNAAAKAAYAS